MKIKENTVKICFIELNFKELQSLLETVYYLWCEHHNYLFCTCMPTLISLIIELLKLIYIKMQIKFKFKIIKSKIGYAMY